MSNLHFKLKAQKLIDYIINNGKEKTCSWTKIDRYSKIEDPWTVVEFCLSAGFIENKGYNTYLAVVDKIPTSESDLYEFIEQGLTILLYDKKKRIDGEIFKIEMTAWSDSKIAGKWTRPDIIAVTKKKYPYIPDIEFDILTFEVKTESTVNVLAVFEALAHRSAASLSYVVFPVHEDNFRKPNDVNQRIIFECAKYGVGLICVNDMFDSGSFVEVLEAQRHDLDRGRGSDFLRAVLPHDKIAAFA
jgi:hypothetical protein